MPLIDVTYPTGAIAPERKSELANELTTALLRAERAPDTDFFRSATWAYLHELPADAVLAAGQPVEKPTFRVEATTPEGALSDRRRAEFVAEATRIVREIAGIPEEEGLRIWVLCREITEGSWGAAGHVISFKALREAALQQHADAKAAAPA